MWRPVIPQCIIPAKNRPSSMTRIATMMSSSRLACDMPVCSTAKRRMSSSVRSFSSTLVFQCCTPRRALAFDSRRAAYGSPANEFG